MVAKLWYLKKIDLISRLPQEEVKKLSRQTTMDRVQENQPIYFPGDTSNTIYILKEGRVKISRQTRDGKKITLALLEPGEIFGELALSDEDSRKTMAETVSNSLICSVSDEVFLDFLSDHPELSFEINRIMGNRRREIESKVENLIFKDARERLAYILEDLFEDHSDEDLGKLPEITFSHQEIADLAGLTRPTTTNLLNELQEDGVLELDRKNIVLKNPDRLKSAVSS